MTKILYIVLCGGYFDNLINIYKDSDDLTNFISKLPCNTQIIGAAHNSFITSKKNTSQILELEIQYLKKNLTKSKIDSWLSERTIGIISDRFKRIPINDYFLPICHGRY